MPISLIYARKAVKVKKQACIKKERIVKLPIGQANVVIKRLKTGYAHGVRRPQRQKPAKQAVQFNAPRWVLRKAA